MKGSTSFIKMKRKMLIGLSLLMALLTSSTAVQSLTCYCDFSELLTCEWNSSAAFNSISHPDTNCSLRAVCDNYRAKEAVLSELVSFESSQPELLKATLKFKNRCLRIGDQKVPVEVLCGGVQKAWLRDFIPYENIKLHPPKKLEVNHANVSWQLGSPHPNTVHNVMFEMQFKLQEQSWKDKKSTKVQDMSILLPEDSLVMDKKYEVRVRSQALDSSFWSDWSETTQWTSTVGNPATDHRDMPSHLMSWLFPSLTGTAIIIIILMVYFCVHSMTCFEKTPDIKNPFEPLYLIHEGNFKSWLGTSPMSLFTAEPECISPIELFKIPDHAVPHKKEEDKKKSFTNSTYFLSQSSKCTMMDPLEPCSEQCPYGPAGGCSVEEKELLATEVGHNSDTENEDCMSSPLETSSSYKRLQKLRLGVESPDSGFAAGSDQDSQEESGSEGLPSPPVVGIPSLPHESALPCPIPQFPHMAGSSPSMFLSPPRFGWTTQNPCFFEALPMSISTNMLMPNPDIMNCTGMVEPASEDYMPVKTVQD